MAKKEATSLIKQVFHFFSELIEVLIQHADAEIGKIKKKVVQYVIVYGLFLLSMLFILIGLVKYLAEKYVFLSEGVGFMVVGGIMIVVLAAYSLISRM